MNILKTIYKGEKIIEKKVFNSNSIKNKTKRDILFDEACRYDAHRVKIEETDFVYYIRTKAKKIKEDFIIYRFFINKKEILKIEYKKL